MAYLTLVVTVLGLACQNFALRRLDASQVATVGNAAPLLTVLWGVWLFGETVTPALAVGGALTLGGIFWTGHTSRRARLASRLDGGVAADPEATLRAVRVPTALSVECGRGILAPPSQGG